MYTNLIQLFNKYRGKRGIGAFNVHCAEMLPYIVRGAKKADSPLIVQTSQGTAEYIGLEWLVNSIRLYSDLYDMDICLHLDHCKDIDFIKLAIDTGYTSVMYDGSDLPIEENIKNTKEVVAYAHNNNVSVEGEIGNIGGSEDGIESKDFSGSYTKLEDAIRFTNETNVDALAVAIGTVHGQYRSKANINYDLLDSIVDNIDNIGLVLHGGTGVSPKDFKRCAQKGMMKFNVGTELNKGYIDEINKIFPKAKPTTSLRKLFSPANEKIEEIVFERCKLLEL